MLDAAGVTAGSRVLDVAAGCRRAEPGRRRAGSGPTGHVLATDISPAILRVRGEGGQPTPA